jgi:hypothetical protein
VARRERRHGSRVAKTLPTVAVALTAGLLAVLGACGDGGDESQTIDVVESEWIVQPKPDSVEAGDVTFNADNQGGEEHELVIIKGDDPVSLPTKADGSVDEEQLGDVEVGHIEGIQAGDAKSDTFKLMKGSYILLCNIVDEMGDVHYAEGMVSSFTVT